METPDVDFPPWFFDRTDPAPDDEFYGPPRLLTHIDDNAIAEVGRLYTELGIDGRVLDLMSSWISHFEAKPSHLAILGMNQHELDANPMADERVRHDLNEDPTLPWDDASFDAAVCCVSVDYLTKPLEVFGEAARVVAPDGLFVCTFSNRCFPTKAIRGWLQTDDRGRCAIVAEYFAATPGWGEPVIDIRIEPGRGTDPLFAVWARRTNVTADR